MTTRKDRSAGGSDPRHRQGGLIVPGASRSGRADESCDGLPTLLAASSVGEDVIAGLMYTCTAGVCTNNAPAKGFAHDEKSEGRKGEGHEPIRLRGGGGVEGESDEELESSQDLVLTTNESRVTVAKGSANEAAKALKLREVRVSVNKKEVEGRPPTKEEEESGRDKKAREQRIMAPDSGEESPEGGDSSSCEERSRSKTRNPKRKETEKEKEEREDSKERRERLEQLERKIKGRGRPPTTGEYKGMKDAQAELNAEIGKRNKLMHEEAILRMTGKEMVEASGTEPSRFAEEAENLPTADLINSLREAQTHILRVQRSSSNLKGEHQGALKASTNMTLGYLKALRTRMDGSANNAEMEILREKQKEQKESLRKMKEELDRMREILEVVQRTAEQERVNAETARRNSEYFRELLEREKEKKEDLERQPRMARHELMTSCWETVPMVTEEVRETGVPALDTEKMEAEREQERDEGGKRDSSHT